MELKGEALNVAITATLPPPHLTTQKFNVHFGKIYADDSKALLRFKPFQFSKSREAEKEASVDQ